MRCQFPPSAESGKQGPARMCQREAEFFYLVGKEAVGVMGVKGTIYSTCYKHQPNRVLHKTYFIPILRDEADAIQLLEL